MNWLIIPIMIVLLASPPFGWKFLGYGQGDAEGYGVYYKEVGENENVVGYFSNFLGGKNQ